MRPSILKKGRNCFVITKTDRLSFLIDGENYYRAFYYACQNAKHSIYISGWDIHSRTRILKEEKKNGLPIILVDFFEALLKRNPNLQIYILSWDYYWVFSQKRDHFPRIKFNWSGNPSLHFWLDNRHPLGASLHQKYVVIDDSLLFIGGLDLCQGRWDDRNHKIKNKYRVGPDNKHYQAFHDVQVMLQGKLAKIMGIQFRKRWKLAKKENIRVPKSNEKIWPRFFKPDLHDIEISALSRTLPRIRMQKSVKEVEKLFLDSISKAKKYIYIENQYFAVTKIARAVMKRLQEANGPQIVLVLAYLDEGLFETRAYGRYFDKISRKIRKADKYNHLRILTPFVKGNDQKSRIKVHSKITIIDDTFLRIGSANISNRSMALDTECDFSVESGKDRKVEIAIRLFLADLLGEHLGKKKNIIFNRLERETILNIIDNQKTGGRRGLETFGRMVHSLEKAMIPRIFIDPYGPELETGEKESFRKFTKNKKTVVVFSFFSLLFLISLFILFWGYFLRNDLVDAESLKIYLENVGQYNYTPLFLILIYLIGRIFFFPLVVLILATALLFPPISAFFYALFASMMSISLNYFIGNLGGKKILDMLKVKWVDDVNKASLKAGFWTTFLFRLIPIAPSSLIDFLAGFSKIKYRDFFWGSFIGLLPGIFAFSFLGTQLRDVLLDPRGSEILWTIFIIIFIFVGTILLRRKFA